DTVGEEDAVQMIDLVLEDDGEIALGLDPHRLVVHVDRLDRHAPGTLDIAGPARNAEAALRPDLRPARLDDLRVEELQGRLLRAVLFIFRHVDGDEPNALANLRRREANARRLEHRLEHVIGELADAVVRLADLHGLLPQYRIRIFHNIQ